MDSVVAKHCVAYVMCSVCPTAARVAGLDTAGMSGLDHLNCVHCSSLGWRSYSVIVKLAAIFRLLATGFLLLCLHAVVIA